MNNNPFEELAKKINENKNKDYLGTMIAEVIEPLPNLKLKLLNGAMELDSEIEGDQIFIARSITNRIDVDVTFKQFESESNFHKTKTTLKNFMASGGEVVHPKPSESPSGAPNTPLPPAVVKASFPNVTIDELNSKIATKEKGKMKAQFLVTLKKGDKVLVITNETEDQFFIVDVMDPLKEVKTEWEYYQKS